MADFSTNLKRLRKRENLSQDTLAEKLSVSRQTVSSWERGNSYPDLDMLVRISEALHTDPNALLYPPTERKEFRTDRLIPDIIPQHFLGKLAIFLCVLGLVQGLDAGMTSMHFFLLDALAVWLRTLVICMVLVGLDIIISLLLEMKERE